MTVRKMIAICGVCMMAMGLMSGCGSSRNQSALVSSTQADKNEIESRSKENKETVSDKAEGKEETKVTSSPSEDKEETEVTSSSTEDKKEMETVGGLMESSAETQGLDMTTNEGKTLVVYYSATGTTKDVAQTLAKVAGGDIFEIEPAQPYTDDDLNWNNDDSRVSREHDDESLRDVELATTTVENWDSYDTVYIGYPIWWGIAAWPVNNFVKANDFTGKTVIPFCTSASSGIGSSGKLLEEMAGSGSWKNGDRIRGGASEDDIRAWVDGLGL